MTTWGQMAQGPQIDPAAPAIKREDLLWLIEKSRLALQLDPFNTLPSDHARIDIIEHSIGPSECEICGTTNDQHTEEECFK